MKKDTASRSIRIIRATILVVAAISLFFAQSFSWMRDVFFERDAFQGTISKTVQTDASRQAIGAMVVDVTLDGRPTLTAIAGDRIQLFVAALIATDMGERLINMSVGTTYDYVISGEGKDVSLQLTTVKQPIEKIIALSNTDAADKAQSKIDTIPDELVIINADEVPNIRGVYQAAMWATPVMWLLTVTLMSIYMYMGRKQLARSVRWLYITILITAGLGIMAGPFVPNAVASLIPDVNAGVLVSQLVAAFLAPFTLRMWAMIGIASIAYIIYLRRRQIRGLAQKLARRVSSRAA